jgi:hypothetical protein
MRIYNKYAPTHCGSRGANQRTLQPNYSLNPLNTLLERVENVRVSGKGYRADCPNGHRSKGSLVISESDEGSVLMHCHSGCSSLEVLHGLGLEMKDLFPQQNINCMTPQERREYSQKVRQSGWKTALELLPIEIAVIECAAVQLSKGKPLNLADHKRLELAAKLVNSTMAVLCGH